MKLSPPVLSPVHLTTSDRPSISRLARSRSRLALRVALLVLFIARVGPEIASAQSYLLSEGFEGTANGGYENTGWTVPPNSQTDPDPDYAVAPLTGEQSLRCQGVSFTRRPFVNSDSFYCYFEVRWLAWADSTFIVDWLDENLASTATLLASGNNITILHGDVSATGTTVINANTIYHVWVEWTRGTGNNDGTMKLFISTDGIKPSSPEASIANGRGSAISFFEVGPFDASADVVYDHILLDDESIGSNPGGNSPPTISSIPTQSTPANTPIGPIPFTVGDAETSAADLTVIGVSSNPGLVPNTNIVFGGSGPDRTVTLTPAADQSGTAVITLIVNDGGTTSSTSFTLTVTPDSSTPPAEFFLREGFEGDGYENQGWSEIGAPNPNYRSTPLRGHDSLYCVGGDFIYRDFSFADHFNLYFRVRWDSWADYRTIIHWIDSDYTDVASVFADANRIQINHGSASALGTTLIRESITYHIWVEWTMGTGEDGTMKLFVSTTGEKPEAPEASLTTGVGGATQRIYIGPSAGSGVDVAFDTILGSLDEIGSHPGENLPPTLSRIADQTIDEDTPSGDILFTVRDRETPEADLVVRGSSSNPTLIPDANIVFDAIRSDRTITVTPAPDKFGSATITVEVSDGTNTVSDSFNVTVNSINDLPVVGLSAGFLAYTEGDGPVILDPAATFTDADGGDLDGGTLTIEIMSHGAAEDRLSIRNQGTAPGQIGASGADVTFGGVTIGTLSGGGTGTVPLVIAFNPNATPEAAQALLRHVTYEDVSTTPSTLIRTIQVVANDGDGGTSAPVTMTLSISPIPQDPVVTWTNPAPITYGTPLSAAQLNAVANVAGTFTYNPPAGTLLSLGDGQPLSVIFTPDDTDNYNTVLASVTLSVTRAPLTATADNKSRAYGSANPELTVHYAGFVNGEDVSVLGGILVVTTTADPASPVGGYPTTPSGLTSANYAIRFVNGTLNVVPAPLTITADDKSRGYGAANPEFTVQYDGFVNGEDTNSLTGTLVVTTTAEPTSAVGSYPIMASGLTSANYATHFVHGTLTVSAATLTITADDKSRPYGGANPELTVHYAGFMNGEDTNLLSGTLVVATTAETNSAPGTYPITAHGLTSGNYALSFVDGELTVTPAALVITADDKSRRYGGANPQLSVSYAGFVNGEDTNVLGGILVLTTTADSSSPVGTYPISASGLTSGHYAISFVDGILTVTAATRPVLTILEVNAKGVVFLEITSDPGLRLRVQRSTNLKTWVDVTTEDNPTGTIDVSDEAASGQPHLFYRTAPP